MTDPEKLRERAAAIEERQRERERRQKEKEQEREREARRRQQAARAAVQDLDEKALESVAERPNRSWGEGGRLAQNAHRALWQLPDDLRREIGVRDVQQAAKEEIERREEAKQRQARQAEAVADGGRTASATIGGRTIETWKIAAAVIIAIALVSPGDA